MSKRRGDKRMKERVRFPFVFLLQVRTNDCWVVHGRKCDTEGYRSRDQDVEPGHLFPCIEYAGSSWIRQLHD